MPGLLAVLPQFELEIASAEPLIAAVSRWAEVPPHVVRWMAKLTGDLVPASAEEFLTQARWAANVPPHYLPHPEDSAAVAAMMRSRFILGELCWITGQTEDALIRGCRGEWVSLQEAAALPRIERYFEPARREGVHSLTIDVHRMLVVPAVLERLRRRGVVVDDLLMDEAERPTLAELQTINRILFSGASAGFVLETLSNWGASIGNPLTHPKTAAQDLRTLLLTFPTWAPLIDRPVITPYGFQIHCLSTPQDLMAEGDIFRHCVGKYPNRMLWFRHHAFTVRSSHGWPLATLVLRQEDANRVVRWDFRGYDNATPGKKSIDAARWFINGLNNGHIRANWEEVDEGYCRRWEECGGQDAATDRLRCNVYDPIVREWVWRAFFRRWTPPQFRNLSVNDFLVQSGLIGFVMTMERGLSRLDRSSVVPSIRWVSGDWHLRI